MKRFILLFLLFSCTSKDKSTQSKSTSDSNIIKTDSPKASNEPPDVTKVDSTIINTDTVSFERLIIPGKSIGQTFIGEKDVTVRKKLGAPSKADAAMGKQVLTWIAGTNRTDILLATNMGNKPELTLVRYIRITSPYFKTAKKLGVGSSMDVINKEYPLLKKVFTYSNNTIDVYDEHDAGIAFEIDNKKICIGIMVHTPGEIGFEIYNSQ